MPRLPSDFPTAPPPAGPGVDVPDSATLQRLERKLDSMRPGEPEPEALDGEDVTGVIYLAVERVTAAQAESSSALRTATERLLHESERTRELTRALSHPPSSKG